MGIYRGSRYTKTPLYNREEVNIFKIRERLNISIKNSDIYVFQEGDTLDGIAYRFYGDSQLWWAILEVNHQYRTELDIKYGDDILIPDYEEVVRVYE